MLEASTLPCRAMPTPEYSPDELTELLSGLMPDIPGYRVMRLIGRGGMSYVYLGVQESLDRQVAIKVIRPDALKDEVSKLRFEKEARTIAKLQHPCIVGIHEVGRTEQGLLFYVMPFLSRGHVGERNLTGDEPRIIEVLRALLWALEYSHARGVVHRDVKSENVLFDNADRPVLADFGIALSRLDRARITGNGLAIGSSPHMAPEQARGDSVDGRADLYSLGVLTYELLCGHLPFQNPDPLGLALMHAVDPIPRLPPGKEHWQPFIDGAMAKAPGARYADAREMILALDKAEAAAIRLASPPSIRPWPTIAELARPVLALRWSRQLTAGLAAVAATLAIIIAAATLWPAGERSPAPAESLAIAQPQSQSRTVTQAQAPEVEHRQTTDEPVLATQAEDTAGDEPVASIPEPAPAPPPPPGARELAAAAQQITRRRLTQPTGDNALESLRAARRLVPQAPELAHLGDRWMTAATPFLADSMRNGNTDAARALWLSAATLATELELRSTSAWARLERTAATPLLERMQQALAATDIEAVRGVKAEAIALGIDPAAFGPWWSQPLIIAKPGDGLRSGQSELVIAELPAEGRPGLAVMSHAVTRDSYARFAAETSRPAAACRIRTAMMTMRKRSWDSPGFPQSGDHPVVCASIADAHAYAAWLGARDGNRYRLPDTAQWRRLADLPAPAAACKDGRIVCDRKGTVAAHAGAAAIPGVLAMHGNVREWQSDCAAGCRRQATVGFSWRDGVAKPGSRNDEDVDPQFGYDDIGFRLVREIASHELEVR
jgi:serine/threonine-protein kinase PpkA